jgi:prepilin-type N-terminal cleavage/methylation domain-containing protein
MISQTCTNRRPPTRPVARPAPRARGLSLPEVMISLAITTMLLTAIAAAFHSSSQIIKENDEFFRATQAGRVCLNQILTEIRRSDAIACTTINFPSFSIPPLTASLLPVSRPLSAQSTMEFIRYYRYNAASKQIELYFQDANGRMTPGAVVGTSFEVSGYPVAANVQGPPFSWETDTDSKGTTYVKRVSVTLDVLVGNNHIRLSGSAAPRRAIAYE